LRKVSTISKAFSAGRSAGTWDNEIDASGYGPPVEPETEPPAYPTAEVTLAVVIASSVSEPSSDFA
jgi:hypothetical protein